MLQEIANPWSSATGSAEALHIVARRRQAEFSTIAAWRRRTGNQS